MSSSNDNLTETWPNRQINNKRNDIQHRAYSALFSHSKKKNIAHVTKVICSILGLEEYSDL